MIYANKCGARGRTMEEIAILLKNSMTFGVIENNLVGYVRLLTDEIVCVYFRQKATIKHSNNLAQANFQF